MAAYVWRMGDKIIRLFYLLFGFDAFDTSKWNKTYHGISQGTLFSINHHVASNVDCNSYKCTFVVHIGKKQMNVKVTIVLVSYTPGPFFWDQINFNRAHKCEWMPFNQCQRPNKQTWNVSLGWAHNLSLSINNVKPSKILLASTYNNDMIKKGTREKSEKVILSSKK